MRKKGVQFSKGEIGLKEYALERLKYETSLRSLALREGSGRGAKSREVSISLGRRLKREPMGTRLRVRRRGRVEDCCNWVREEHTRVTQVEIFLDGVEFEFDFTLKFLNVKALNVTLATKLASSFLAFVGGGAAAQAMSISRMAGAVTLGVQSGLSQTMTGLEVSQSMVKRIMKHNDLKTELTPVPGISYAYTMRVKGKRFFPYNGGRHREVPGDISIEKRELGSVGKFPCYWRSYMVSWSLKKDPAFQGKNICVPGEEKPKEESTPAWDKVAKGNVTDSATGESIPEGEVILIPKDTVRTAKKDEEKTPARPKGEVPPKDEAPRKVKIKKDGSFQIPDLAPGSYDIVVKGKCHEKITKTVYVGPGMKPIDTKPGKKAFKFSIQTHEKEPGKNMGTHSREDAKRLFKQIEGWQNKSVPESDVPPEVKRRAMADLKGRGVNEGDIESIEYVFLKHFFRYTDVLGDHDLGGFMLGFNEEDKGKGGPMTIYKTGEWWEVKVRLKGNKRVKEDNPLAGIFAGGQPSDHPSPGCADDIAKAGGPKDFVPGSDEPGIPGGSKGPKDIVTRGRGWSEKDLVIEAQADAKPVPNDPLYNSRGTWGQPYDDQWALKRIGFTPIEDPESAWRIAQLAEHPVIVAVIDSGVDYAHPDLQDALWVNVKEIPGNGVDDDKNGYVDDVFGWNFVDGNNDIRDNVGHGTVVAGIIAASVDNGIGISGINPWARIMPVKVLDIDLKGGSINLTKAIYYAVDNGARVINLSVGGKRLSRSVQEALDYAYARGVTVVAAAGNIGANTNSFTPAGLRHVITVAATDDRNHRTRFSNWGQGVDVAAPGVDILSLRAAGTDLLALSNPKYKAGTAVVGPDGRYYRVTGTSFSSPFVAGVASLLLSLHPGLTTDQVARMILNTADDIEVPGWDQYTGYGILNASKALRAHPDFYALAKIARVRGVRRAGGIRIQVLGTAVSSDFAGARLEIGLGRDPDKWLPAVTSIPKQVLNGVVAEFPPSVFPRGGRWTLRLTVQTKENGTRQARGSLNLR